VQLGYIFFDSQAVWLHIFDSQAVAKHLGYQLKDPSAGLAARLHIF
jgi:hypothetical protein